MASQSITFRDRDGRLGVVPHGRQGQIPMSADTDSEASRGELSLKEPERGYSGSFSLLLRLWLG